MAENDPSGRELDQALEALVERMGRPLEPGESPRDIVRSILGPGPFDADPFAAAPVDLPAPLDIPVTLTVRLDLVGAKPPIWRTLELPGDLTLDRVHDIIQLAMGWEDCHLHRFELPSSGRRPGPYFVNDGDEDPASSTHEASVRLDQVLRQTGDQLLYEYDFGDSWQHVLQVKDVGARSEGRVRCTGGRRAGPPEDCGGVYGYSEILEALATPPAQREEWAQEQIDWLPGGFDPKAFDAAEVDDMLAGWQTGDVTPGPPPPPKALLPLLTMGPFVPAELQEAIDAAQLDADAPEPSGEVASQLVEPWMMLLREVGDGLKLTQAGYLPPATVKRIFDALGLDDIWIGKGNREDQTLPVAELRSSATALGLLRKSKGKLLPTKLAGKFLADPNALVDTTDPAGLLRHIASRLPLSSSQVGSQAAALLLLCVAAGSSPGAALRPVADMLTQLGWRTEGYPVVPAVAVSQEADDTYAVLSQLHSAGGGSDRLDAKRTTDVVRDLARRALRDDPNEAPAGMSTPPSNVTPLRPSSPPPAEGPSVEMDPEKLAKESGDALMRGIADARQALEAERVLCAALGAVHLGIEGDEQEAECALEFMLGHIVEYVQGAGSEEALGLLRVASVLGPQATRDAARAGGERLATDGVTDRPWADRVGVPSLRRAWHYGDDFGIQESVGLTFDYRGREHTLMVLIDNALGGGVKDVWVAEGKQSKRLHDDTRRTLLGKDETYFDDIDAAQAAEVLEAALEHPSCPEQDDQVEDVARHLHLLRSRTRRLRDLASGGR